MLAGLALCCQVWPRCPFGGVLLAFPTGGDWTPFSYPVCLGKAAPSYLIGLQKYIPLNSKFDV